MHKTYTGYGCQKENPFAFNRKLLHLVHGGNIIDNYSEHNIFKLDLGYAC